MQEIHFQLGKPQVLAGYWPETAVSCDRGLSIGLHTTWWLGFQEQEDKRDASYRFLKTHLKSDIASLLLMLVRSESLDSVPIQGKGL